MTYELLSDTLTNNADLHGGVARVAAALFIRSATLPRN